MEKYMAIRIESNNHITISGACDDQKKFADGHVHSVTAMAPDGSAVPMGWFQAHESDPGAWIGPPPLPEGSEHIGLSQPGSTATFQRGGVEIRYVSIQLERR